MLFSDAQADFTGILSQRAFLTSQTVISKSSYLYSSFFQRAPILDSASLRARSGKSRWKLLRTGYAVYLTTTPLQILPQDFGALRRIAIQGGDSDRPRITCMKVRLEAPASFSIGRYPSLYGLELAGVVSFGSGLDYSMKLAWTLEIQS